MDSLETLVDRARELAAEYLPDADVEIRLSRSGPIYVARIVARTRVQTRAIGGSYMQATARLVARLEELIHEGDEDDAACDVAFAAEHAAGPS